VGIENMAAAFYVVYSREQLKLPESAVGVFSIAIVVGGLIGIAAFGWLAMRFGARRVLQTANVMQFAAPLLALGVALSGIGGTAAYAVMVVVLGLNGAINRSSQLGYFTYTQESAAEIDRPMYMGAVNSIGGVAALMPLLGGLLIDGLQRSGAAAVAFPAVFALAGAAAFAGVAISLRLPALSHFSGGTSGNQ
jgi:MFS family permease